MKSALKKLGSRAIDRRTRIGKALAEWRSDIERDLGGPDGLSAQQHAILDLVVKTKLMLDSIDAWLLTPERSLINARKRALIPAVKERTALADALARYLGQLGLERPHGVSARKVYDFSRLTKEERETFGNLMEKIDLR